MKIVTNNNISNDKTSLYFAEKFSYYTRQEIEDFAKLYNFRTYNITEKSVL